MAGIYELQRLNIGRISFQVYLTVWLKLKFKARFSNCHKTQPRAILGHKLTSATCVTQHLNFKFHFTILASYALFFFFSNEWDCLDYS